MFSPRTLKLKIMTIMAVVVTMINNDSGCNDSDGGNHRAIKEIRQTLELRSSISNQFDFFTTMLLLFTAIAERRMLPGRRVPVFKTSPETCRSTERRTRSVISPISKHAESSESSLVHTFKRETI